MKEWGVWNTFPKLNKFCAHNSAVIISQLILQKPKKITFVDKFTINQILWIPKLLIIRSKKLKVLQNWRKFTAEESVQTIYQKIQFNSICDLNFTRKIIEPAAGYVENPLNLTTTSICINAAQTHPVNIWLHK